MKILELLVYFVEKSLIKSKKDNQTKTFVNSYYYKCFKTSSDNSENL